MVRLREIPRTAAFAWSSGTGKPYLVTGTRAGAVDDDFSAESKLELWDLKLDAEDQSQELSPIFSISTDSRFYDIAWGQANDDYPSGIIAGALENGSLDLWDAAKLITGDSEALISRTTKHTGPIKALQFNLQRPNALVTAGFKGELYVYDVKDPSNAFRLGTPAARADDLECVAWNSGRNVSHILAAGGSGGFVMVWDVKTKKASWTLNVRKPVSAIAWDPNNSTKLLVATSDDNNPVIQLWDLRNSNAPERVLTGHEQGVLSLSWCRKDSDLLLSCGKDNKTLVWNPQTGEKYGEFPEATNWTFLTRFNPHNPFIIATASFDGKIVVQTLQNTNAKSGQSSAANNVDGEDFFSAAQPQPLGPSFSLPKAPSWLACPVGASFGFGGKLVVFKPSTTAAAGQKTSKLTIEKFTVDSEVGTATDKFEERLKSDDLASICKERAEQAKSEEEKADWLVMENLVGEKPREKIAKYLGFSQQEEDKTEASSSSAGEEKDGETKSPGLQPPAKKGHSRGVSNFFGTSEDDGEDFLASLKSKTDTPFHLMSDGDTTVEKEITSALLLGNFAKATDLCLKEGRMADAFLIANCGGSELVEKVQAAYLTQKEGTPSYLRLLSSVIAKNLWDVVWNADLDGWKETMAVLCTYSTPDEFPGLCETLGDRLLEKGERKDASLCFLVGSKLEKVVSIWIAELEESEKAGAEEAGNDSTFSLHARHLQQFIEKVTIFRHVTKFEDDEKSLPTGWKLNALYEKYTEYADIVAAHGQLGVAQKYLDLLPSEYPAAEVARERVRLATQKPAAPIQPKQQQQQQPAVAQRTSSRAAPPLGYQPNQPMAGAPPPYAPSAAAATPNPNPYAPQGAASSRYKPPGATTGQYLPPGVAANPYAPTNSYQPPAGSGPPGYGIQNAYGGGPPKAAAPSVPPPSKAKTMDNWNDVPIVAKGPPRRTPSVAPMTSPFPGQQNTSAGPPQGPFPGGSGSPVPPPPKGPPRGASPPQTVSPNAFTQPSAFVPNRPTSTAASTYTPPPPPSNFSSAPPPQMVARTSSPYNAAPHSTAPPSNRYAPSPAQQASQPPAGPPGGPRPPSSSNPYMPQSYGAPPSNQYTPSYGVGGPTPSPYTPHASTGPYGAPMGGPPQGHPQGPPPQGPPQGPPKGPPPQGPPRAAAQPTPPPPQAASPPKGRHPAGDRSHLTPEGQRIFELLDADFRNVASKAPPQFEKHVKDTEKRLNFLYDHLNNGDLLQPDTVAEVLQLAELVQAKNYEEAQRLQLEIHKNKTDECENWMAGVKRLITLSKNTI